MRRREHGRLCSSVDPYPVGDFSARVQGQTPRAEHASYYAPALARSNEPGRPRLSSESAFAVIASCAAYASRRHTTKRTRPLICRDGDEEEGSRLSRRVRLATPSARVVPEKRDRLLRFFLFFESRALWSLASGRDGTNVWMDGLDEMGWDGTDGRTDGRASPDRPSRMTRVDIASGVATKKRRRRRLRR